MGLTKLIVNIAIPTPRPEKFERFLFIGPHPDDIEIGAGATAARFAAEGKKVCFLICTDGRFGTENLSECPSVQDITEIRKKEALASADYLGVKDVRFLGLSDGGFYTEEELVSGIAKVITDFKPDAVFCPDPSPTSECHRDHLNVGNAVKKVCCFASNPGIMNEYGYEAHTVSALCFYMTAKPNGFVKTNGYIKKQLYAVKNLFPSQIPEGCGDYTSIPLYIKVRSIDFGIRSLKGMAEGFRVIGKAGMHCVPEKGE